jgi:hypothetical protein
VSTSKTRGEGKKIGKIRKIRKVWVSVEPNPTPFLIF